MEEWYKILFEKKGYENYHIDFLWSINKDGFCNLGSINCGEGNLNQSKNQIKDKMKRFISESNKNLMEEVFKNEFLASEKADLSKIVSEVISEILLEKSKNASQE